MKLRLLLAALLTTATLSLTSTRSHAQDDGKVVGVKEPVSTVDGVTLRSIFYGAVNPKGGAGSAPVVVILHAYKANPDDAAWEDTAKLIAKKGFHVIRFDFRGHGESKDMTPDIFWRPERDQPWALINGSNSMIRGAGRASKQTIDKAEFNTNYYPMLIQDIAAIRNHLDKKNDNQQLNSSSIYLLAAGDAINLAMLFIASEYKREAKRPNRDQIDLVVTPTRYIWDGFDPAGEDIRGVIALSPSTAPVSSFSTNLMNRWVFDIRGASRMRTNTYWQMLYGKGDERATSYARIFFNNVLKIADSRLKTKPRFYGPDKQELPPSDQSFLEAIDKTNASGVKLLGNNLGTEDKIIDFINAVEAERGKRERVSSRDWTKPLYIEPRSFGVMR